MSTESTRTLCDWFKSSSNSPVYIENLDYSALTLLTGSETPNYLSQREFCVTFSKALRIYQYIFKTWIILR